MPDSMVLIDHLRRPENDVVAEKLADERDERRRERRPSACRVELVKPLEP